jgi:hypothetical protein
MRYRARGGLFSGGANLSWPLAALELSADSIRIAPRWLANRLLPPVEIPLSEITVVETTFGFSRGVRFRLSGPADGTVFWAAGRTRSLLVDELRRAGLNVQ